MADKISNKKVITKDTIIGDVLEINPKAAEVMFDYGLHCIGCFGGTMETVEQGAKAHGLSDEKIEEMLEKINKS